MLAANDFARLWPFFGAWRRLAHAGGARTQYREVWSAGLRAAQLLPRVAAAPADGPTMRSRRAPARRGGDGDGADTGDLGRGRHRAAARLLDGLEHYVPRLRLVRVPGATHWIVHEQPALVAEVVASLLPGR